MRRHDERMNTKLASRLMFVLTICYGITIALLGTLGSSALTIVAVAGALVIGGLWAILGVFSNGKRS
jgi:hypothetical protein